ncbi:hypothetical protein ABB37_01527 [Leptomonas pyrrhocoris]|uniref:Uncharacterized protein n=1 Tax=Leptomonas pyrrhocoris TaxID=157538 RepID=A0A0N0DZC6_LEPPY|nr:hypothetical protein ABB37_01527 [Leptomonas pyrrhocoris]KPA85148.1 hypothetical protein ABB37_01527 [Leptomonas pyrrhocoris]|eukprot:XP_015663587.1 hypothetical protein ABB37_01527 [Leptomonas pyrrhocoris]
MHHSPKSSSPRCMRVPSPVVLPALSTSEADHILAHASATLEDYFDKDDMPSVLASVAAAARETDPHRHPFSRPKGVGQSSVSDFATAPREVRSATFTDSAAPLSSLTTSPPSRGADNGFYATTNSARQGRLQSIRRSVVDGRNDGNDDWYESPRSEARGSHVNDVRPITITPSVERILEAVQLSSHHSGSGRREDDAGVSLIASKQNATGPSKTNKREDVYDTSTLADRACSNGLDERFSPIELHDSPNSLTHEQQHFSPSLSSFYTATGRSREDGDKRRDHAAQITAVPSLSLTDQHRYPILAPTHAAAPSEDHARDFSSQDEKEEDYDQRTGTRSATRSAARDRPPTPLTEEATVDEDDPPHLNNSNGGDDGQMVGGREDSSTPDDNKEQRVDNDTEALQAVNCEDTPQSQQQSVEVVTNDAVDEQPSCFPYEFTDALPFLDYLARVNGATAPVLLKELVAMGDAWAATRKRREQPTNKAKAEDSTGPVVQRDEDEVIDYLAVSLLLNQTTALQHIVVPLLRAQLKSALRVLRDMENEGGNDGTPDRGPYTHYHLDGSAEEGRDEEEHENGGGRRLTKSPASAARAANLNCALCAVIGLGGAASTLLPLLLQLLLQLPPPTATSLCDVRLVGLAIRTSGAAEGLRALTRIVEERAEASHVLTAAAYALSTYAYELTGHTSAVCVPAGTLQRAREDALYRLVPDPQLALSSRSLITSVAEVEKELRPLWNASATLCSPSSPTAPPTGMSLMRIQSPPPYHPTHIVIDAEAARQSLQMFIASDKFRGRRDHPYVMLLLDDALNSSLLCPVIAESSDERTFKPIWDRMRRDLHCLLCNHRAAGESRQANVTTSGFQRPLLLYSIRDFFADEKDMLFAVEAALVHALVSRSALRFQEQALLSLAALPPEARMHVVQPVTDFFLKVARRYQLRHATTMRRARATAQINSGGHTRRYDDYGGVEGAAEEAVVVAAAIAAGTVCVNPLTPASCTLSCIAALVPVLTELLQTSQWRVRHAACVGLARMGPHTADPSSIVDLFLSLLSPAGASSFLANSTASESYLPALQPATIAWCLVQQQQGGVRALLRVLQDTQETPPVHDWCAFQLAAVDVYEACREVDKADTPEADALLDEMVQVLGKLIAMQGALEEDTVVLCVRALAEVVHRTAAGAVRIAFGFVSSAIDPHVDVSPPPSLSALPLQAAQLEQEAATYYESEPLNSCFTVLTSVMEAALLPTNVLKALCLYLCKYGGAHGELYVCEMLLESTSVAARSAAAFGLRACGAKVIRSVVLGMNDASFEVRREALDTMDVLGAQNVLAVLHHRPAEHRHQVLAALRDCLLRDAGRSVARKAADTVYHALAGEEQDATELLLA